MAYDIHLQEEELKNKVAHDYFAEFDSTQIIGKIDFCIAMPHDSAALFETEYLLWAEAKAGTKKDIYESFVQLILTIGKARTFDHYQPPFFLGAFDAEKIAFLPYENVSEVFYQNDFNWNVTPSNHDSKEFRQLYNMVKETIEKNLLFYHFKDNNKELRAFIRANFKKNIKRVTKKRINLSNLTHIYQHWCKLVKPSINISWDTAKASGILDADFFFADVLSKDNLTLKDKLFVLLKNNRYILDRKINDAGLTEQQIAEFMDGGVAHTQFWNHYVRPPKKEYWESIVTRRDRLVPQDVRERKGSYFTPQQWVELSQEYLAAELGEDWQDEYYIWDCAAGTGNLLNGLSNKYNIWASTLDQADVDVMHDRIENGANLLHNHVFQFDFLNDPFTKLPQPLQDIINDEEKRKKLVIYINPPYAEASDTKTLKGGKGKNAVEQSMVNKKYKSLLGQGNAELFVQFFTRIYLEIPSVVLAEFSKLKILQGPHFADFRKFFRAKLGQFFVIPANTFDNVKGQFPIGFMVWDTKIKIPFISAEADVYNRKGDFITKKTYQAYDLALYMNEWIKPFRGKKDATNIIGKFPFKGNDFQNQNMVQIVHQNMIYNKEAGQFYINYDNVGLAAVYFAVRKSIEATWLNDRDQFLYPNDGWQTDNEFQADCLAYTLFNNNIQSEFGINHWIPFTEQEVNAKEKFQSNFMSNYIQGKCSKKEHTQIELFDQTKNEITPLVFSEEAQEVMDAGRELWRYYHAQPDANPNAALYDIRLYFQGKNEKGKMNNSSNDARYTQLITTLRENLKTLAQKIEPKVYEYGFLKK